MSPRSHTSRVTSENWRVICACQRHRSGLGLIEVPQLRGPVAALLITTWLVLLGTTFPIEAMNLATLPSKIILPTAASLQELPLVTSRLKEQFLRPDLAARNLVSEFIKEEFFRTEVPFGPIIYSEATRNGLAPELVAAVVETESDFRPTLLSHKNAHGLMQLMPSTGELMGVTDLFNPSENVRAGAKYLRYLQGQFKDPEMMLAAYNAGESTVRKYGGIPPYPETQNFVRRVARNHERYQKRVAERMVVADTLLSALTD